MGSSQTKEYVSKAKKNENSLTIKARTNSAFRDTNLLYKYCGNKDGFLNIDLSGIKSDVLSKKAVDLNVEEGIFLCTQNGRIELVTNLKEDAVRSQSCRVSNVGWGILDIAISKEKEKFIGVGNKILKLNEYCGVSEQYNFGPGDVTSLSFDRMNNLYFGGSSSSIVYRIASDNTARAVPWHDFGSGNPAGDFVMYNDKMYIAWVNNENSTGYEYKLLAVVVDAANNYISHEDLGLVLFETYGLASELGVLYGVTPWELYKVNLNDFTFETILVNTTNDSWFGASGKNEAVNFLIDAFETLDEAQNNLHPLDENWTNTIAGGQTIFFKITETQNDKSIIVPVDIVINTPPVYVNPVEISTCKSDPSAYEFDLRGLEGGIVGGQASVRVDYYGSPSDAADGLNPLADRIEIDSEEKKIFVKLTDTVTGCHSFFDFDLRVLDPPVFYQPDDILFCRSGDKIYYQVDLEGKIPEILKDQDSLLHNVTFYESLQDALYKDKQLLDSYIVTVDRKEIFARIENKNTHCYAIGSFFIKGSESAENYPINFELISDDMADGSHFIQVVISQPELYEFSIDGIVYQKEPFFYGLILGNYKVFVRSNVNCNIYSKDVLLFTIPKFFTPNDDGHNDFWCIQNAEGLRVSIFDRYGRLLKVLINEDKWDGAYNGTPLPSGDYWFLIQNVNGKEYRGHFSLLR